ncbi:hypothetical protein B0T24DRAFT_588635 [Lasiosphaeria ovina]|uniref:Ubiquitin-like domain-containing protein n=1 Tax=Lasiosphaeria ovina TaxID=92902 RepID=A0AAE0NM22_9PEZI|nr:hypothetical protein B0T24DRAFT_588635 [Lasiosphaeria ovina]
MAASDMSSASAEKTYLMIEEINSDLSEPQLLSHFPVTNTVKDLKMAIARMMGEATEWDSVMVVFVGEVLEDNSKQLSFHKVQNGDTIFFVRSVEPPPPYDPSRDIKDPLAEKPPLQQQPARPTPAAPAGAAGIVLKTVFFRNIEGRSMTLEDLSITMTIAAVKAKLAAEKNMENNDTIRFIWGGKTLENHRTLMDYNIGNNSTIEIVWRLPGGAE